MGQPIGPLVELCIADTRSTGHHGDRVGGGCGTALDQFVDHRVSAIRCERLIEFHQHAAARRAVELFQTAYWTLGVARHCLKRLTELCEEPLRCIPAEQSGRVIEVPCQASVVLRE